MLLTKTQKEDFALKIIEFKEKLKIITSEIKEQIESHPDFESMNEFKTKAKKLSDKINSDSVLEKLKESKKELKKALDLNIEVLVDHMEKNGENEIDLGDGVKIVRKVTLNIKKEKK